MKTKRVKRTAWFVYVIECRDASLYTGIAKNPDKRLAVHNAGKGSKAVRSKLPAKLVFREKKYSRSLALKREAAIKRLTRAQKLAFIRDTMQP